MSTAVADPQPRTLEEITADIKEVLGVSDDSPRSRAWRIICNNQRDCSCCGKCGEPISPDERVLRTRISQGPGMFGGRQSSLVSLCQKCGEDDWHWKYRSGEFTAKSCAGCARPMWAVVKLQWSDRLDGYEAKSRHMLRAMRPQGSPCRCSCTSP